MPDVGGVAWEVVVLLAAVAAVGGFVQAVAGLGVGLLLAPAVALTAPSLVPVLPLWIALLVAGATVLGERHYVDWRVLAWALPARVPGTVLGAWLVVHAADRVIALAVAVMVLGAVALTAWRVELRSTPGTLVGAGALAGAAGTATSIGGPPLALVLQRRDPEVVRSTLAVFFLLGILLSIAGLAVEGELTADAARLAAVLAPGVVLGVGLGALVRDRVPREGFRAVVLAVCAASALVLLVRSLLG